MDQTGLSILGLLEFHISTLSERINLLNFENKIRCWHNVYKNYCRGVVEYVINNGKVDEVIVCPNNCDDIIVVTGNTVPLEYKLSKPSNATIVIPTDDGDVSFVVAPNEIHAKKFLKFKDYIIEV